MTPSLNAAGIVAKDLARSLDFYRLLGCPVPEQNGPEGDVPQDHVHFEFPDGFRLMFDTEDVIRSFRPDWSREAGNQLSLAFECASPAEVDEVYARVTAAGFEGEKEPWDAFWGQHYAQLRDPDGVPVDLYATL
jgi:catechol 2,3-dioxygenase-like lactoylglutathione lyase family enzyme